MSFPVGNWPAGHTSASPCRPASFVAEGIFFVVVVIVRSVRAVLVTHVVVAVVLASKTDLGTSSIFTTVEESKHMNMDGAPSPGQMHVPQAPREGVRQQPVRVSMSEQSPLRKAE